MIAPACCQAYPALAAPWRSLDGAPPGAAVHQRGAWGAVQAPLPMVTTSHGPVTRRRLDDEWASKPLRSRLPARESW